MIISRDTNPERDLYYLGAKVIQIISKDDSEYSDFFDTYLKLNQSEKNGVSVNLYLLTLDWLFLTNVISGFDGGKIKKCF